MPTRFPHSRIDFSGFPSFRVDGRSIPAVAYTSYLPEPEYYRQMADCGLRLICFPAYLAGRGINIHSGIGAFRKGIWRDDNTFDFSDVTADFDKILSAIPDAVVLIRLHLDVPTWWEKKYPNQCCLLNDGSTLRQCFSSPKWMADCRDVLKQIISWLSDSAYAHALAGIHLAAGGTEEWVYHYYDRFEDNSSHRVTAFRKWMIARYGSDAGEGALPADINPDAPFTGAVTDTLEFHASELADRIDELARTVKEASSGRLLTGAFYGYHYFITDPRKGHNALGRLLESPHLDYLASPNAYDRQPGLDWPPMAAADSVRLHGKLWMAEHDTRTFRTTLLNDVAGDICPEGAYSEGVWIGPASSCVSAMLLRTNAARMLTNRYGGWWFDMWGGWFDDFALLREIEVCQKLAAASAEPSGAFPEPEVCVIADEKLLFHDNSYGALTARIINQRQALAKAGTPYKLFLRNDLAEMSGVRFKFLWLLGWHEICEDEQQLLGHLHGDRCGILHTSLTGSRWLDPEGDTWRDAPTFCEWTPEGLRELYRLCGVHIYLDSDDIVYVGNGFAAIHAASEGGKTVTLPQRYTVRNAIDGAILDHDVDRVSLEMSQYETVLLRLVPVQ